MKIATWNVERLKHIRQLNEIEKFCYDINADILVLTETDARLHPDCGSAYHSPLLFEDQPDYYKPTENRVSIFTRYPCVSSHKTYDARTALCMELKTEKGPLLVYGTIMGIYGNRHPNFKQDLDAQIQDIKRLSELGKPLCIVGDYNLSFSDNWYFTTYGRETLGNVFDEKGITILTAERAECIDHIAITSSFVDAYGISIEEWNQDKSLSDHKGIAVSFL